MKTKLWLGCGQLCGKEANAELERLTAEVSRLTAEHDRHRRFLKEVLRRVELLIMTLEAADKVIAIDSGDPQKGTEVLYRDYYDKRNIARTALKGEQDENR